MYNDIQVIIMAGGVGSRFWPMSTPDYPKQFIDVMGVGRSLIQLTVDRLKPICPVENMWVVTNEKYIRIVKEQMLPLYRFFSCLFSHYKGIVLKSSRPSFDDKASCTRQFESELSLHSLASLFPIKEGSTFLTKPLFNSLYDPF